MDNLISQNQIIEEINLIPDHRRKELYDLIHQFRISLERSEEEKSINKIMQFAGSWLDNSEDSFKYFDKEIEQRRQTSSSRRFSDET